MDIRKVRIEKGNKCWDVEGVYGSGVCEYLDEFHHCKNCPVYALGGRHLLEREISPDMIKEWTSIISLPKEPETRDLKSFVIFRIADEWLALNTNIFQEAVVNKFVHFVPSRTNDYLHGIINVNGELLVCISLAKFLNLPRVMPDTLNGKENEYKYILIIFDKYTRYAFPADEFLGVSSISEEEMSQPPLTVTKSDNTVTKSIISHNSRTISIIDDFKLFSLIDKKVVW
ncbi:MAG: chemotaxis protein CheW [Candidatus Kapabacteria bacterium]|nr:chemotaxis protein CheW [Ignavibacteriota bacterium]MCW5886024.1 chemotaxis protein CheW [Candidatus Kapabacteria bacterium]